MHTHNHSQRLQTKALEPNADPILVAVAEHAQRFEAASAASALEIKKLSENNAEQVQRLEGLEQELVKVKSARGGLQVPPIMSPVADFIASEQLKAMKGGATGTGKVMLKTSGIKMLTKAISNTGLGQAGDNAYNVRPDRDAVGLWNNPQRRLTLLDLLPTLPISSSAFEYIALSAAAPIAGVQLLEGDAKQQANVQTAVETASVITVAHWVRASQQVIDDAPALNSQLNNLLSFGCLNKLESIVVNGSAGANGVKGLVPSATAFAATSTDAQDRIGEAITALLAAGYVPSVIVMSPVDWGKIQRARGETNDTYLLGSPRDPSPPSLWSVPVVTSASLAIGTALVLDASQVSLLDRQEVIVQISTEDGNNFTTNMVTIRAELRAGLAVFSPAAVLSVALAA